MTLVSSGIRIVRQAYKIQRRYQYLNPSDKFIRKYVPPQYRAKATRLVRMGEVATTGGLLYDVIDEIGNGFQSPVKSPPYKQYQKRGGYKFRNRRQFKRSCPPGCTRSRFRYPRRR